MGSGKAARRHLAGTGCTVHIITAINGHISLAEVQRYTKAVARPKGMRARNYDRLLGTVLSQRSAGPGAARGLASALFWTPQVRSGRPALGIRRG